MSKKYKSNVPSHRHLDFTSGSQASRILGKLWHQCSNIDAWNHLPLGIRERADSQKVRKQKRKKFSLRGFHGPDIGNEIVVSEETKNCSESSDFVATLLFRHLLAGHRDHGGQVLVHVARL